MTKSRYISHISKPVLFFGLLLGLPILAAALLLQWRPTVPFNSTLDNVAINSIEELIVDNAPARIGAPGEIVLHLDSAELNLLAAFLLQNIPGMQKVTADVAIQNGSASVEMSVPWSTPLATLYLNLHSQVSQGPQRLELSSLKIGHLPIPDFFVHFLSERLEARLASSYVNYQELVNLQQSLREVSFSPDLIQITMDWEPRLISRLQTQAEQLFLSAEDKERIVFYFGNIVELVDKQPPEARSISLNILLFPLFEAAAQRVADGADPVVENRSLLQALSLYVNESDLRQLVDPPGAAALITPRRLNVTIQRRPDLAQHFTSSAAMSATVGAGVAGILSTSKEVHDARYRSGFSFSDLTANIAGVALGNAATSSPAEAQQLQHRLASASEETDYMPPVSRDNAGLTEDDFSAQFTDRNSEAYVARLADIDEQIAALPIYFMQ
jgi:hypothetical protein